LDIHFIAPDGYILSENDLSDVSVNYRGSGFNIIRFKLFHSRKIDIYLPDRQGDFVFRNEQLNTLIREQNEASVDIFANTLEEIRLYSDLQVQKKLPVVHAIEFTTRPGYIMKGNIQLTPDSVNVTGPKKIVDTISHINTESIKITELTQSVQRNISLIKPQGIQLKPHEVNFTINIEQLTEKEIEVKLVDHLMNSNQDSLLVIPAKVSVRISLPISQYESFTENMLNFDLTLDTPGQVGIEGMQELKINSGSPFVKILDYQPDSVRILKVLSE
jgi:hypothetical protein